MYDIVGILRFAPPLPDEVVADYLQGTPVGFKDHLQDNARKAYSTVDGMHRVINSGFMPQPRDDAERAAVKRAWGRLAAAYPWAYVKHRWRAFHELLGLEDEVQEGIWVGRDPYGWDINDYAPSPFQQYLQRRAQHMGKTWLARPYLYLGIVLGLTALAVAWRQRTALALGLSAMISEFALFFACPTPDFRYSIWLVVSALVMFWILLIARYRQGPARQAMAPHAAALAL
jgi:hypothetical protein